MTHQIEGEATLLGIHTSRPSDHGAGYTLPPHAYATVRVAGKEDVKVSSGRYATVFSVDHYGEVSGRGPEVTVAR